MKITQLLYTLCVIGSCFLVKAQAGVVNYYTNINSFSSSNTFPQGGFVDGLIFNSSMSVSVSGATSYRVIYRDGTCNTSTTYNWKRYLIVPESVKDTTNTLTINLLHSYSPRFLVGIANGIPQYAYEIDTPTGTVSACNVGGPYSGAIANTNTSIDFQSSVTKEAGTLVAAKPYSFQVPVRIVAVVDGTGTGWYSEALSYAPLTTANLNINITNFCNVSQNKYDFDFGTLTEGSVNEPGFQLQSDIKELNIDCIDPANLMLSVITADSEGGNPNKVKMGNDLVADFYINNALQNNTTFTGTNNIHIPLHANLRKNISSTGQVQAGQYTGASVIKIIFQ
ncbi:hypothetical protein [Providencia rettgeri]|uniref:hypothetical protein n=1 Tax=Providencia rettgeri TaxID=587 RepID=UPI00235DF025|nr:hypothetical protein [Providencia rettgeri]